jgi:hypothetical protein
MVVGCGATFGFWRAIGGWIVGRAEEDWLRVKLVAFWVPSY